METELQLGIHAVHRRDYLVAVRHLQVACLQQPGEVVPMLYLGAAFRGARQLPDAQRAFMEVARMQPREVLAFYNLGAILVEAGSPEQARSAFERALAIDPAHRETQAALAALASRTPQPAPPPLLPHVPGAAPRPAAAAPIGPTANHGPAAGGYLMSTVDLSGPAVREITPEASAGEGSKLVLAVLATLLAVVVAIFVIFRPTLPEPTQGVAPRPPEEAIPAGAAGGAARGGATPGTAVRPPK